MRIALAADHAGFALKTAVSKHLADSGHQLIDFGTESEEPVDYPLLCAAAARAVVGGGAECGIVFGGSGQGEQIAANKIHGIRAALCQTEFMARLARRHNDANVLALGGRVLAEPFAISIVDAFVETEFEGGRHARRIEQIASIELEECAEEAG